jgi:hypothetical protein
VTVDRRARVAAVEAVARDDDIVVIAARPGVTPLPRDAGDVAGLPVRCTVVVPTRPHAGASVVTGTATLVGSRRTA